MNREFTSPMKTVYQAIQDRVHKMLLNRVPPIWSDDVAIFVQTDVIRDELIIDLDHTYLNTGADLIIPDISQKIMQNENLTPYINEVVKEFSDRTSIRMLGDTGYTN